MMSGSKACRIRPFDPGITGCIHGSLCGGLLMVLAGRRRKEGIMGKKKQMRSEVKGNVKNSIGRIAFAALAVLLQIGWILVLMIKLYQYSSVIC